MLIAAVLGLYLIFAGIYLAIRFWYITLIILFVANSLDFKNQKKKIQSMSATSKRYSPPTTRSEKTYLKGYSDKLSSGHTQPYYVVKTSRGKCSGFAINNEYLITAYHCIKNFEYVKLTNPEFRTYDARRNQEGIVVDFNKELDIALIKGSFKDTQKLYLHNMWDFSGISFETCGAPEHRKIIDCFKVKNVEVHSDYLIGEGFTRPGMSGSALVDRNLNIVLGVLIGTTDKKTHYVRISKIFEKLNISQSEVNRIELK